MRLIDIFNIVGEVVLGWMLRNQFYMVQYCSVRKLALGLWFLINFKDKMNIFYNTGYNVSQPYS